MPKAEQVRSSKPSARGRPPADLPQDAASDQPRGSRAVKCDLCKTWISRAADMSRHRKMHSKNAKDIACPVCQKLFAQAVHVTQHMLAVHSTEKNYQCGQCPAMLRTKSELTKHEYSKHNRPKGQRRSKPKDATPSTPPKKSMGATYRVDEQDSPTSIPATPLPAYTPTPQQPYASLHSASEYAPPTPQTLITDVVPESVSAPSQGEFQETDLTTIPFAYPPLVQGTTLAAQQLQSEAPATHWDYWDSYVAQGGEPTYTAFLYSPFPFPNATPPPVEVTPHQYFHDIL